MDTIEVLDELIEITGSTELHKRMRFWFVEEIAEEEGLLKFLRDRCDDLSRKNARLCDLLREMEALGERGVAIDSLESLKQTHARETAKLADLIDAIAKSLVGIHEKERHVTGKRSCDAFYWTDLEIYNGWYKNQMIELYLALNPDERYQYVQQTRLQDSIEMLQAEYEVYQADMEFKLYEARKRISF
nr:hypothetical protein [Tanacetum cinerariifolium]